MSMLYVDQVASYFRTLCDEDDETWQNAAAVQAALELGEDEYRGIVTLNHPMLMEAEQELTVAGRNYNLATGAIKLLGATASPRMSALLKVARISSASQYPPDFYFKPGKSLDHIHQVTEHYLLKGQSLWFGEDMTGLIRVHFVPVSTVDWSKQTSGNNEYIDDLVEYHDLIALLAHKQYSLRDEAVNTELDLLLQRRRTAFEAHLFMRCQEAALHMGVETW